MEYRTRLRRSAGPVSLVVDRLVGYMDRWMVFTPWFSLRLHRILRSDADGDLHDHPWDFASLILRAGYREEEIPIYRVFASILRPGLGRNGRSCVGRVPGDVVRHAAEDLHRLEVSAPALTLVLTGPVRRSWGFLTEHGWMKACDFESWSAGGRLVDSGEDEHGGFPVLPDGSRVRVGCLPGRPAPPPPPRVLRPLLRLRDRLLHGSWSPAPRDIPGCGTGGDRDVR